MPDTPEAVLEALRENHERPHGLPRTVTAEELVEAAEAVDKPDVLATALLELMTAYEFTGEHRKSPVAFARILKLWDTDPGAFGEWGAHQVFWRFKWVTTSLLQVPEVPLAAVHGWIDQMRDRYEAAGHSPQPVAAMRYHVAHQTGTGLADAYDLWATRPRSELSDCEACETRHLAWHQVTTGDDAGALDTWQPVLDGRQGCGEEPQASQARALLPLLRTGRTDEARSHHLTGYRRVRGNTGMQHEVGLHLEFCALSRNEGRGLEILAENRPLFEATGAPLDHLGFLTGAEVLLARLADDGHADTTVAGPAGRTWSVGELLAHVRAEADPLAAAFDARNGTGAVGDLRRARLDRTPVLAEPLPLGLRTPAARGTAALPVSTPSAAVAEAPEDFVALVLEARRLNHQGHPSAHRLWDRVAERLADGTGAHEDGLGPRDLLSAELAEHRVTRLGREERNEEGAAELRRASELFDGLDMPWHALSARTRALAWTTDVDTEADKDADGDGKGDGDGAQDAEAMRAAVDACAHAARLLLAERPFTGDSASEGEVAVASDVGRERRLEYLVVLNACVYAAHQELLGQLPEPSDTALERFEERTRTLRTEAERLSVPHQVAAARQYAGDVALRRGDVAGAEAELRAVLDILDASDRPWRGSRSRGLLAQILLAAEQPAEAVELLHQAIADAVRHDDVDFPLTPSYALLGHAASHLGDTAGAVRYLSEAAARFDQEEDPEEATRTRLQLADVLARGGQQADAVAVLESVLGDEATSSLEHRPLAQARLTLARGLRDLEEYLPAAEEFLRLADTVAGWEDAGPVQTLVAAEAAVTLAMADRWEAADSAYERAVACHAEAPNAPVVVDMMREFARLTVQAGHAEGTEAALAHLARADAVLGAVAEGSEDFARWYEEGSVHYRRALVLADAERFTEALAEAEAAIAAHRSGGEDGEVPRAEAVRIAALIEANGLGRRDDAVTRLTAAIARCRTADLPEAARILEGLRREFLAR
ncbi:hypothetical protein ACGF1Z_04300 [Streptomyces sp. NPDC048018]|uniref:tetratricopeptide repeat protein n=1 Tax=Streptomyces sp. NPDC048018 TaxID=3365499 RepID=UPI00370FC8F0